MNQASDLTPDLCGLGYQQAIALNQEHQWKRLRDITLDVAISAWLQTVANQNTRQSYSHSLQTLIGQGILNEQQTLQQFALSNGDALVDLVKQLPLWSEATRQARAAALLSFIRFLSRRTQGLIKQATANREGTNQTFFKVREEVATPAMNQSQWVRWLQELEKRSPRDALIARVILQGGRRVSEVLTLTSDNIEWSHRRIRFELTKTKGTSKEALITYPQTLIDDLSAYLGDRTGLVFITRGCCAVSRHHMWRTFVRAGEQAQLPFRVTPHVLRASCVTFLKQQGVPDSDIMRITGHASAEMVAAYDKTSKGDNATQRISLAW